MVMIISISLLIFVTLLLGITILVSNNLIAKKNRTAQAYGSLEVYLKKRYDLIPNLVATVKKYTQHERELLTEVTALRETILKSENQAKKIDSENKFGSLLSTLQIRAERYPELKADTQFLTLQYSLNDIEDQLSASRRAFNAAVTEYNNAIQMFPGSIVAGLKNYEAKALLEIPKSEQYYTNIKTLFES
jgi:LemA protein